MNNINFNAYGNFSGLFRTLHEQCCLILIRYSRVKFYEMDLPNFPKDNGAIWDVFQP